MVPQIREHLEKQNRIWKIGGGEQRVFSKKEATSGGGIKKYPGIRVINFSSNFIIKTFSPTKTQQAFTLHRRQPTTPTSCQTGG
jgi:hypothetical protein